MDAVEDIRMKKNKFKKLYARANLLALCQYNQNTHISLFSRRVKEIFPRRDVVESLRE